MLDFPIQHRSALGDRQIPTRTGVTLRVLPEGCVLHILGKASDGDISAAISEALGSQAHVVRNVAPGQWFVVGDRPLSAADLSNVAAKLAPFGDVVDQSHGRVRIELGGEKATAVLAKGTAVDLSLTAFPVGHATTTLVGHVSAHLTRTGTDTFEILVLRSFAESLWDELETMSAGFD